MLGPCLGQENVLLPSRKVPCPQPGPLRTRGLKMLCRVWQSCPQWYSDGQGMISKSCWPIEQEDGYPEHPHIPFFADGDVTVTLHLAPPLKHSPPIPDHLLGFRSILNGTEDQRVKDHNSRRRFHELLWTAHYHIIAWPPH